MQANFETSTQRHPYAMTALVLQGGGALGAYQAGVYEGLSEAGIAPGLGGRYFDRRHQCGLDR